MNKVSFGLQFTPPIFKRLRSKWHHVFFSPFLFSSQYIVLCVALSVEDVSWIYCCSPRHFLWLDISLTLLGQIWPLLFFSVAIFFTVWSIAFSCSFKTFRPRNIGHLVSNFFNSIKRYLFVYSIQSKERLKLCRQK